MVPDDRAGAEADRPALLLQAPADVDVVAGDAELRVEPADLVAGSTSRRPCCSRGCARRSRRRAARGSGRRARWRRTRAIVGRRPGGGMLGPPTPACELFRKAVREVARASAGRVARRRRCRRRSRRWRPAGPRCGRWRGRWFSVLIRRKPYSRVISSVASVEPSLTTITSKSGIVERAQPVEAARGSVASLLYAQTTTEMRGQSGSARNGASENALPDRRERLLGLAVAVDQAEGPVVDVEAAPVPLVRPGEHEHARRSRRAKAVRTCQSSARACASSLLRRRVEAGLGHDQRAVAGDVLEPRQVGLELAARLEEHVEAARGRGRAAAGTRCSGS